MNNKSQKRNQKKFGKKLLVLSIVFKGKEVMPKISRQQTSKKTNRMCKQIDNIERRKNPIRNQPMNQTRQNTDQAITKHQTQSWVME